MTLQAFRRAAALGVLVCALAGAALAQEAWHTMTGPDKTFTTDLPTSPKYTPQQMTTGTGSIYTMHQYIVEQGAVAYVVQSAIYPQEVNVSAPKSNLQAGLDNAAKNMDGGKWTAINWVKHQGLTAVDALGARQGHEVRSYTVMKGRQIFTLTYAGPPGSGRSTDVNRFMSSLRVRQ